MGFLDKAKAAANDLAARADTALAGAGLGAPGAAPAERGGHSPGSGDAERYLRDLGVLAYLEATGRPSPGGERDRILGALHDLESRGALRALALHTTPPPAPGTAGAQQAGFGAPFSAGSGAATPPPPGGGLGAPPVPGSGSTTPPASPPPAPGAAAQPTSAAPGPGTTAVPPLASPPPPPSWMKPDEDDRP